jgi:hypothetical protein
MTAMPLIKSTLAQQLEAVFKGKPQSAAQAASDWAAAYVSYAAAAMSTGSSLPVTASANQGMLVGAFTGALQAQTSAGAAALMAQGVTAFWSAMVWTGAIAVGTTVFPGNPALSSALAAIFADTSGGSDGDKAGQIADAFDAGAKMVIVNDVPLIQPAAPIVGPIS